MLEMLSKIKAHEFFWEGVALLIIASGLLFLLFKTVMPNMGVKAVPATWMTAFGATLLLSYTIFYDLKPETHEKAINTRVIYSINGQVFNSLVDHKRAFMSGYAGLMDEVRNENISIKEFHPDSDDITYGPVELVFLNVVDHFTSTIQDWRKTGVSTPLGNQFSFRRPEQARGDTVLFRFKALKGAKFKSISTDYGSKNYDGAIKWFDGYAIWPRHSKLELNSDEVVVSNPNFTINVKVFSGNGATRVDDIGPYTTAGDSDDGYWLTSQQVIIQYTLRKSRSGHWRRSEYRDYCEWLCESLVSRLEAPSEEWPKVIDYRSKTQQIHSADGRSSRS